MSAKVTYEELEKRVLESEGSETRIEDTTAAIGKRLLLRPSPPRDIDCITFEDLFELDEIQRLQDELAAATGLASIITRPDGKPITRPSNFRRLCADIIRKTDRGRANCYRSDALIGRLSPDGPIICPCTSGVLWDAGAGISVAGRHIANWLVGQVRDTTRTESRIRAYAREIGADEADMVAAFHEVPAMPPERLKQIARMLFTLANQLSTTAYQHIQQSRFMIERRKTEEALKASESRYRSIVENSPAGIVIVNESCQFEYVNNIFSQITGRSVYELTGQKFQTVLDGESKALAENRYKRRQKGETVAASCEFDILRPDGKKRRVEIHSTGIKNSAGRPLTIVQILDITENRCLQQKLIQSQKMEAIGTLAGGIAHDFNNILGAILGYAQLAKLCSSENPKVEEYIDQLCIASERAKDLVRQILAFSRQDKSKMVPVDIGIIIKETLKLLRASIPATIEIRRNVKSDLGTVKADATQIHQIVMNLCTNAFHAMEKEGGQLSIDLIPVKISPGDFPVYQDIKPGRYLQLTVSDTGQGMDAKTVSRIFEPYFTTKALGAGTGMGLATVHGIVKNHKGDIKVYSEPGIGTSFHILFPLITNKTRKAEEAPDLLPGGNEHILFVDDENFLIDIGKKFLEGLGYRIEASSCPLDALEAFRAEPDKYQAVITDMTMPKMTGVQLSHELLKIRPHLPIILCTGFSRRLPLENTEKMGINHILMKPLTLHDLAQTVRRALDEKSMSPGLTAA